MNGKMTADLVCDALKQAVSRAHLGVLCAIQIVVFNTPSKMGLAKNAALSSMELKLLGQRLWNHFFNVKNRANLS